MKRIFIFLAFICCHSAFCQGQSLDFTSKEKARVHIDSIYYYQPAATDSADGVLTFSVKDLPSWLHYNAATHAISGKAIKAGQYLIHFMVTNGDTTAHQRFMLTVYDNETMNILPLGNSITNGVDKYNSYRRDLWQMLHKANYNFDFIGSWSKHHWGTEVPNPDFDMDHEGHSGWTYNDILHRPNWDSTRGDIYSWLQTYKPDIVLVELGTNDVFHCRTVQEDLNDLDTLINLLRKKNAAVKIFVAQIPPLGPRWDTASYCGNYTLETLLKNLNKQVVVFAKTHTTSRSPVVIVDQFSGIDPKEDQFDDIHPNEKGEEIMAARWFKAIHKYLKKL